ncbi:MAG TPA: inositol monophosphatase [Candidatus Paceibacterota bacterium]|nr:inositol monophosphatase [Candidatus Paceibacterota bacterium]
MASAGRQTHLDTARDLAAQAGAIMRANFKRAMKKEWKDERSPVTETDLAINDLVLKEIKTRYPDHGILAEEASDHDGSHEFTWICDPVDGTHNFSHGLPTATFALALLQNGQPILGVINDPFEERMYWAEKGKGAFQNGNPIRVASGTSVKKTLIGLGKTRALKNLFPVMDELYQRGVSMITGLSIHYLSALVASGEFSASIFGSTSAHDMTPGKIIVEEAGGRASDIYGNIPERFDEDMQGQVCSNGGIHDELIEALKLGPDLKK